MSSLVSQAQAAFLAGQYQQAIALYQQAIADKPELAKLYAFGLQRAQAKLASNSAGQGQPSSQPNHPYLSQLWQEADQAAAALPPIPQAAQAPWVSVLMTAHNVAPYVEQAAISVLRQNWPHLELIIIDDASTDDTWRILRRLQRSDARVQIQRLNTNLGTYFAKNWAFTLSKGQIIFFQDGDDISHPQRIRLGVHALTQQSGAVCVRGAYSRVAQPSGQIFPVNGEIRRLGLITLGVRRQVFERIGLFNATSKASDEEFFTRLQTAYAQQPGAIVNLRVPTYYNTLRDGSLFADMIANNPAQDGHIQQIPSPSRQRYVQDFTRLHQRTTPQHWQQTFRFPVLRDVIPVAPDMTRLSNPSLPVVLSLCSIPERTTLLHRTLHSLAPQVDAIHLYLDRYEQIPDFVPRCHTNITIRRSQDHPGLRDNGKFLPLSQLEKPCYFFTADDDIHYPPDYVHALIQKIELYERQVAVGVHGVLVPEQPQGYFSGYRRALHFMEALEQDQLVNNLGTGTMAVYSERLRGMDYRQFTTPGMVDLYVGAWCQQQGVPMLAIARHEKWLSEWRNHSPNLFDEFVHADTPQTQLLQRHAPWGYTAIQNTLAQCPPGPTQQRLQALLPLLRQCLA